jgi:Fe-S-cluster containining protein
MASDTQIMDPWYQGGLQFRCTRCGNCCTGTPGYVWVDDEEIAAIADLRAESVFEATALYTYTTDRGRSLREKANGDCIFYDKAAGCTVYPARPRQCRTWPFWESNLASSETWRATSAVCPGAGRGELIPAEEITRRLKVIRL